MENFNFNKFSVSNLDNELLEQALGMLVSYTVCFAEMYDKSTSSLFSNGRSLG